jgi:2-polyprenyl-6-hydroxyphenyl methylase / 3-demethylubiquinone-9 3-methyltransferase
MLDAPPSSMAINAVRPRNDVRQYDDLAAHWWRPDGPFAMLHWLAKARAALIPRPARPGAVLVDLGCGGGLLAPHIRGYRHIGVDLVESALGQAARHGVTPLTADAARLPLADGCADVVSAGEILEHVPDLSTVVAEACRVLRPGGTLVLDTLADTALSKFVAVTLAERVPGVPRGLHDPDLFVNRRELVSLCARHGVAVKLRGIRPAVLPLARWLIRRRGEVPIVPSRSSAILFQGRGVKAGMTERSEGMTGRSEASRSGVVA